jgi:GT2 family glycosyltransferase
MSQKMALEAGSALIIVESDVIVEPHTLQSLIQLQNQKQEAGMVAAVTTNQQGEINFPYSHISPTAPDIINTKRSLSFCCTLLSNQLLASFDFNELNEDKDWYDVHISKKSRTLGFENFLVKSLPVIHLPHSSRPWKMEKYKNPFSYYLKKYFLKRDRI